MPLHRRLARSILQATSPQRQGVGWWDVSEVALVALGFLLYFLVRGAPVDRTAEALQHARWIVELEQSLGVFIEPQVQEWVLSAGILWRIMNFVYFWFDFPLIVGAGLLMFFRSRTHYTLLRDSLLLSGGIALVIYYTFPVAPPRFLTEWGFVDTLEVYSNLSYQAQSMQPFVNPYAAVPSLHVGWAALLVYAVFRATPNALVRVSVVAVFVLQSVAVIGTGNHFVFDGVAGLVVCAVGLAMAVWLQRVGYPLIRSRLEVSAHSRSGGEARRRAREVSTE